MDHYSLTYNDIYENFSSWRGIDLYIEAPM